MATRRAFLATAAAWWSQAVEAAHQHNAAPSTRAPYKFRFFQLKQITTLQTIAAVIIPADERSGGASAARVEEYIDFILFHGAPALKNSWSKGLVGYSGK